ncbi:MAG: adenine deaminase [Candidatus Marinimicrobia bacterium CG08_land_8_20_14_0_20_45_22]|nr:MAG: adenine deaminase [Candidatus Marinimicrobia bacterium CG08_land_8_20_14_0_20_45_22]
MFTEQLIRAARGEVQIDLLLKNARIVNLISGEIYKTDIGIFDGRIVGFGDYLSEKIIDLDGQYIAPGLIDGHVHIESSLLSPAEFARTVLPFGTTTVVADPHEIANVLGSEGIQLMIDLSEKLPIDIFFMIPSCVPATPMETSGAVLSATEMKKWIDHPRVLGIGEMMNFPGVLFRVPEVLEKLAIAGDKVIDGHAPMLSGKDLSAYIAAGISSDHESTYLDEAREKLRNGMFLMIREGSAARNLEALLPVVTSLNSANCGFVTDDRHPDFLLDFGHIDEMVRRAIRLGLNPINALQMASLNTARHFNIRRTGAIAPGFFADMIVFDDFEHFNVQKVFKRGRLIAENGKPVVEIPPASDLRYGSVSVGKLESKRLKIEAKGESVHVIEIIPDQILTKNIVYKATIHAGETVSDIGRDILKIAVIERHHQTGNIGLGFVKGFGLKSGAIASTVAHDSHNLIVIGARDEDMLLAVEEIVRMNGGQIVVENGKVKASLPLPLAGLMSDQPVNVVRAKMDELNREAKKLGSIPVNPFMTLSFLALPVIPELKITDKGLVDVGRFAFIPLFAE